MDIAESIADLLALGLQASVVTAGSGEDALALARRSERFDLVITDHHMGFMSGMDLLQILSREGLLRRGMLFSGDPHVEHDMAMKGVPYAFLPKGEDAPALVAKVRALVAA